jgi:universal stress protein E
MFERGERVMKPIRLILVAIENPGPQCHRIVAKAARLAQGLRADLELFHVVDVPLYVNAAGVADDWIEHAQKDACERGSWELERHAARLRNRGLQVGIAVEWAYPSAEAIARRAAQRGADLIVAERQAGSHMARSVLQSTEWDLVRRSPVPVLITSADTRAYHHPIVLAAVDPARAHAKPAALDREILSASETLNHALAGTLHVMHAYRPTPPAMPLEMQASNALVEDIEASAEYEARRNLGRLLASFRSPIACRHLVGAPTRDAIRSVVRSTGCSVIVMGAVARDGLEGFFVGNTAQRVLDDLDCDLLIVKPRELPVRSPSSRTGRRFTTAAAIP